MQTGFAQEWQKEKVNTGDEEERCLKGNPSKNEPRRTDTGIRRYNERGKVVSCRLYSLSLVRDEEK